MLPIAAALFLAVATTMGLYARRWSYGSLDEVVALGKAVGISSVILVVARRHDPRPPRAGRAPASVPGRWRCSAWACSATRGGWPTSGSGRPSAEGGATPVIVFGAGEGGEQTITALLRDPHSPWFPVAMLDDDPRLARRTIRGVRVAGTRADLAEVAERFGARTIVIAIPSASSALIRELCDLAEGRRDAGVRAAAGQRAAGLADRRRPTSARSPRADLLGRREVAHRPGRDRRLPHRPARARHRGRWLDRLRAVPPDRRASSRPRWSCSTATSRRCTPSSSSIDGRALLDSRDLVVCRHPRPGPARRGVRRAPARGRVPRRRAQAPAAARDAPGRGGARPTCSAPQTVLEAAERVRRRALRQHLDRQGRRPDQRARLLEAGRRAAHGRGAAARRAGRTSACGSATCSVSAARCSTTFTAQVDAGWPVTVTHPDVTRYFMTVEEAVQLVIQAGAIGGAGEALVLDMGEPVRIDDVAQRLAAQSERPDRDRLHRPAPGREAARGPLRPDRDRRAPLPPAHHPRRRRRPSPLASSSSSLTGAPGEVKASLEAWPTRCPSRTSSRTGWRTRRSTRHVTRFPSRARQWVSASARRLMAAATTTNAATAMSTSTTVRPAPLAPAHARPRRRRRRRR